MLLALSALLLVAVFSYTWPQEPLLPHASATNKGETSMTKYDTSGEEDVQTVQEIVPQVRHEGDEKVGWEWDGIGAMRER